MNNRTLILLIAYLTIASSARLEAKQTRSTESRWWTRSTSSTNWWDVPTTTAASETRWWGTSSTASTRPWWDTTYSSPATTTRPWWETSSTATTRPWWDTTSASSTTRPWWETVTRSWTSSTDSRPPWWTQTTAWTTATAAPPSSTSFSYANFYIVDIRDQLRSSVDTVLQEATYEFAGTFPYLTPPMDGYEYRLIKVVNGTKDQLLEIVRGNTIRFSVDVSRHETSFSFVVRYDKIGAPGQMGSVLYSSNKYTTKIDNWNAWKPMCDYKAVSAIAENSTVTFYARGEGCHKNVPLKVHIQGGKLDQNNHGLSEIVTLNSVRPAPYSNTIQYMSELHKSDRQSAASTSVTFVLENNNFPGSQVKVSSNVLYVF